MIDVEKVDPDRPFAVRLDDGSERCLLVHLGRNRMPNGVLTWEPWHAATWFETRDGAERQRRRLVGEKASVFDGRTFR